MHARENGADILVILDGDGQHPPELIPRVVQPVLVDLLRKNTSRPPIARTAAAMIATTPFSAPATSSADPITGFLDTGTPFSRE